MSDLTGKTIVITGSAKGLGKGLALILAKQGANIVINYRSDKNSADKIVDEINATKGKSIAVLADVQHENEAKILIKKSIEKFSKIDVLINNVGEFIYKPLDDIIVDDWQKMLNSNLMTCVNCCNAVLPHFRSQKIGRIINIGLVNANAPKAFQNVTPYAIAKMGVLTYTKSLAVQEAKHNITANCISLGLMDNGAISEKQIAEQNVAIPMGKSGSAHDIAGAVDYLISEKASYVTGTEIIVSGGWGL